MTLRVTSWIVRCPAKQETLKNDPQPDNGDLLDKNESKVTQIEPNLPIEKFLMIDYL